MLVLATSAPALAQPVSRQFNLQCRGFAHNEEADKPPGPNEPWFNIYRVDLDKNLWCSAQCDTSPSPISFASDDQIVFKISNNKLTSQIIEVNRITGKLDITWSFHGTQHDGARKIAAQCERAEFTGLPVPKF